MLILLLLVVGTILVLAGLLTGGSLFLQAYVYNQPVEGIFWRGPTAGAAVGLFIGLWLFLARGDTAGRYQTLFVVNPSDSVRYEELSVPTRDGTRQIYKAVRESNGIVYRLNGRSSEKAWSRAPSFFVKEKDSNEETEFKADRDEKGNFQIAENQWLAYRDARGRVISEKEMGVVTTFRLGQFIVALLLNFGLLVVMFAVLWLLLEYHVWHAFGLAIILWGLLQLFVMPPLLSYAESLIR